MGTVKNIMISKSKLPSEQFIVCVYYTLTEYYKAVVTLESWEWKGVSYENIASQGVSNANLLEINNENNQWEFKWSGKFLNFDVQGCDYVVGNSKDEVYDKLIELLSLVHLELYKG